MSKNIKDVPSLRAICEILVEEYNAVYIAVTKQSINSQCLKLLFHTPPGSPKFSEVNSILSNPPESVRVGGNILPTVFCHVLHGEIHEFRRVPLYVHSQPGMGDVTFDQGIENARRALASKVDYEFSQSKSIELPILVEELANVGAVAVELRNRMLVKHDLVDLRIPVVPAEGYPVAGPYDSVTFNGQEYDFRFDCTLDGPGGYGGMRTPLYLNDSKLGRSGVTVESGIENFKEIQTIIKTSNSPVEALEQLCSELSFHN